jgi:hypothetical protein
LPKSAIIRVYRTIVLPVDLYGCETWSLTLVEKYGLRVFVNDAEEDIWAEEMK